MDDKSVKKQFTEALPLVLEQEKTYTVNEIAEKCAAYMGFEMNRNTLYVMLYYAQQLGILKKPQKNGMGKYSLNELKEEDYGEKDAQTQRDSLEVQVVTAKEFLQTSFNIIRPEKGLEQLEEIKTALACTPGSITSELAEGIELVNTVEAALKRIEAILKNAS